MIVAIGIDTVENYRFASWHTKSYTSLQRIFSEQEIVAPEAAQTRYVKIEGEVAHPGV